jgi:glycosyltransferase 2 family protein
MSSEADLPLIARASGAAPPASASRKRWWLALRIVVPLGLLAYLLSVVSLADLLRAMGAVSATTVAAIFVLIVSNLSVAAVRWRVTLRACGITGRAPVLELLRLHWIGAFYNQCVPGGVGGEVVRALATRRLFGTRGFPAALGIALLERLLGLCGLLVLVTAAFAFHPLPGVSNVLLWSSLGVAGVLGCIGATVLAPRLAPHMPGPLHKVLEAVPVIESFPLFGLGLLLSVGTQLIGCVTGHLVMMDITPQVTLQQSMVIMPLILGSQYFPLTIGGAGVRELAFVSLYGLVGVPQHDSLAASLVVMAVQFLSAAAGGIIQMLRPLDLAE